MFRGGQQCPMLRSFCKNLVINNGAVLLVCISSYSYTGFLAPHLFLSFWQSGSLGKVRVLRSGISFVQGFFWSSGWDIGVLPVSMGDMSPLPPLILEIVDRSSHYLEWCWKAFLGATLTRSGSQIFPLHKWLICVFAALLLLSPVSLTPVLSISS